ncbi:MAG: response regulator transcription factor [Pseudomonadota bacterium]
MEKPRILLVEDDEQLAKIVRNYLKTKGFEVDVAHCVRDMWRVLTADPIDVLILDLELPDGKGMELISELRARDRNMPIIVASAHEREEIKTSALQKGADDFMSKPYGLRELETRIEAVFRRYRPFIKRAENTMEDEYEIIRFGPFTLDVGKKRLTCGGHSYELSDAELKLLHYLVTNPNHPLTRDELCQATYGVDWTPSDRRLDQLILKLRRKIEQDPENREHIVTLRGTGFMFYPEGKPK